MRILNLTVGVIMTKAKVWTAEECEEYYTSMIREKWSKRNRELCATIKAKDKWINELLKVCEEQLLKNKYLTIEAKKRIERAMNFEE